MMLTHKNLHCGMIFSIFLVLLGTGGCSIDADDTERKLPKPLAPTGDVCSLSVKKGCVAGHIVVAPNIWANQQPFLDADDLGRNFSRLTDRLALSLVGDGDSKNFALNLITPIDNQSFVQDFQVYIKSWQYSDRQFVRSNGQFQFNELAAGDYQVRAQKNVSISWTSQQADAPENAPIQGCAIIYSETNIAVEKEREVAIAFENFSVELVDTQKSCF